MSDAQLLPTDIRDTPADLVARPFGEEFTSALLKQPVGGWQGPIRSGYGLHFVKVIARSEGGAPTLESVRVAVARDVENDRRTRAIEAFYAALRQKFDVRIEADLPKSQATK